MMWRRDGEPVPEERAEGVREMAQDGEVTVVGQGARLEGTIVSAGSLRIDGQVKGQVNADGDVMLSPQSQVEADINAENVIVAGRFKGNIVVKGKAYRSDARYKAVLNPATVIGPTAELKPTIVLNDTGFAADGNWWDVKATIPNSAAVDTVKVICGAKTFAELKVAPKG